MGVGVTVQVDGTEGYAPAHIDAALEMEIERGFGQEVGVGVERRDPDGTGTHRVLDSES